MNTTALYLAHTALLLAASPCFAEEVLGTWTSDEEPRVSNSTSAVMPSTAGDVGELPFEGARSQNIENNPMQSSRRSPA
jgi:hypothetical protein